MSYETSTDIDFKVYDDLPAKLPKSDVIEVSWRDFPRGAERRLKARLAKWGISLSPEDGVWLAGGTLIRLMNGEDGGDLDFLFKSSKIRKDFCQKLIDGPGMVTRDREAGHLDDFSLLLAVPFDDSILHEAEEVDKLQALKWQYPKTAHDIFDKMDLRLCHWAYDGEKIYTVTGNVADTRQELLKPHRVLFAKDTLRRTANYVSRGYLATAELLHDINKVFDEKYEKL